MIFYYTDNSVSQGVARAMRDGGHVIESVSRFSIRDIPPLSSPPVFYGILRGTGRAILNCMASGRDFYYMDNGYYDAIYMDSNKFKDMGGKYRVVKNDLIERYQHGPVRMAQRAPMKVLFLPPSPYAAFMYDTTPEDWLIKWTGVAKCMGDDCTIREKDHQNPRTLEQQLEGYDALFSLNSVSTMKAVEMGKAAYDTHGILRNSDNFDKYIEHYDIKYLNNYYENKQFTLKEISEGAWLAN